ncbi:hypothetical protein D1AOALGA4SA_420 [Olavius algarvensis Delta 1 endosymbiont]|nr:hypothetical protein D1AOALGA4SA_420 [Olavius algarvensis Delta 1 endosymbiont]
MQSKNQLSIRNILRSAQNVATLLLLLSPSSGCRKDPGPEDPALISPQRGGVYLRLPME